MYLDPEKTFGNGPHARYSMHSSGMAALAGGGDLGRMGPTATLGRKICTHSPMLPNLAGGSRNCKREGGHSSVGSFTQVVRLSRGKACTFVHRIHSGNGTGEK